MPDSNPGPLPQKSGALPMSHHIIVHAVPPEVDGSWSLHGKPLNVLGFGRIDVLLGRRFIELTFQWTAFGRIFVPWGSV